jgi:glycerophosphoryl diester phosphodiesterase
MTPTSYSPGTFHKSAVMVGSAKPQPPRFVVRRRHVVGAIAVVFGLLLVYLFGYEPGYHGTLVIPAPRPLIFARGGLGDSGPNNSLYAVEHALETGMDGVDLDGQLTSDGKLVAGLNGAYKRTFEEFVRSVKGRGMVMVELNGPGRAPTGIEDRAVEVIQKYDAHLSVVLSSSNPLVISRVKQLDPFVRTAFIFADASQGERMSLPWILRQEFIRRAIRKFVRFDLLSINHQVDEAVIDRLIGKGWPVFIWTPDTDTDIRRALAKRPYGVISAQPILARQLRGGE